MTDTDSQDQSHSHHDHHHHHHGHDHGNEEMSFSERNRTHWNKSAATYNSEQTQRDFGDLINKVNAFILTNINWLGVPFLDPSSSFETQDPKQPDRQVRVLDYACGPGTITNALSGFATEYVGIDLSDKMVEQYNLRFTGSDSPTKAHATTGNLLSPVGPPSQFNDAEFYNFDLAAIGLGFHHFENLEMCMSRLVDRLKPGGVFMIIDFLTHKANDLNHEAVSTVAHNGFSQEIIGKLFSAAGLVEIDIVIMKEEVVLRKTAPRTVFMAKGKKI